MPIVEFTITVTYPPNAAESDYEDMLDELIECTSKYGLGVDGDYIIDPIQPDREEFTIISCDEVKEEPKDPINTFAHSLLDKMLKDLKNGKLFRDDEDEE